MVNRCINCGGLLNYDISTGNLKCESCDSFFEPEEYADKTAATENAEGKNYSVSVFTCPNCGGSISAGEAEAVEYCLYCGSFVTLTSQIEKVKKPDFIIPFSKTKEDCVKSYSKMMWRKFYAPKEFRNEEFLKGFKGIYIPYWTYGYEYGPEVNLVGETEQRKGDYIHKQKYNITCKTEGELDGISFDASSSFDDDISSRITPFDVKKLKPFKSPYMFGFYADTADIQARTYHEDAIDIARDQIWSTIEKHPDIKDKKPKRPEKGADFDTTFNIRERKYLSMLPVWFLTWRNKDRVAYSVVNGDTGSIYSEVPVDVKRYLLFSSLLAIVLFVLLESFFTFNASNMLVTSVILSLFMTILYSVQLDKIVRRLFHADDKGYLSKNKKNKKEAEKITTNFVIFVLAAIWDFVKDAFVSGIGSLIFIIFVIICVPEYVMIGLVIVAAVSLVYFFFRIGKNAKLLKDKTVWLDLLGSMISMVLSILMLLADPAGDEFYYVMAILCAIGVGITAILTMKRYNELITRPIPHFFDREKGGEA